MTAVDIRLPPYVRQHTAAHGKSLTASGQKLDLGSAKDAQSWKRRHKECQDEAWHYYDTLGEIWFAHQFVGHCLSRVRIFAAILDPNNPDQPPTPLEGANYATLARGNPLAASAVAEVNRWKNGGGGHGEIMRDFGINLGVTGDCALVGHQVNGAEVWRVYSNEQLTVNAQDQFILRAEPEDRAGTVLDKNTSYITRVWRKHPRWDSWADSPMKAILDECDELSILSRMIRSVARSRLSNGILAIPTEASLKSVNPTTGMSRGEGRTHPFWADLMEAMTTPIADEGAASAVMPFIIEMKADLIDKIKHIQIERPLDPEMAAQRQELIVRISNGLDIPSAILLGLTDVNHWTAWQIDEQTFKAHIEPLVLMVVNALTVGTLWPAIGTTDPAKQLVVWYDPSMLVGHPDRGQDAKDAHGALALSDSALRGYLGFKDTDAPSEEERTRRMEEMAAGKGRLAGDVIPPGGDPAPPGGFLPGTKTPANGAQIKPSPAIGAPGTNPSAGGQPSSLAGSGARRPRSVPSGARLARLEDRTRTQLLEATDAVVFRGLERAGAALRRKVGHSSSYAQIDGLDNWRVAEVLGPDQAFALIEEPDLLHGLVDPIRTKYNQLVAKLQAQILIDAQNYDPDADLDRLAQKQDDDRKAGWLLLAAGVTTHAAGRLFNPLPMAPPIGEFDRTQAIPPGVVRSALSRAGGSTGAPTDGGAVNGHNWTSGVTTGDTTREIMVTVGLDVQGYVWRTGDPSRPFEPHQELGDQPFSSFDDDVLSADPGEWPYVDSYRPGDHGGCECDFEINWGEPQESE